MGQEPASHLRRVALAGVDVDIVVSILAVTVDDVLAVKYVVLLKRVVRSESIGIDGGRLLLVVGEEESHG